MSEAPQTPPSGQPPSDAGGSRNLWVGLGVGAGVIIVAVVLFLVLRPDDSDSAAASTSETQPTTSVQTTTEVTTSVQTTTEQVTTTAPANQPQRILVVVEDAEPVGGVRQVPVAEGAEVELVVRADVEDEVHLHGYNLSADVAPGQPARITFTADLVGEFEAELEDRSVRIVELVVS